MAQFECPTCTNEYVDILDHIRKKHPTEAYTELQLQPLGLTPCPHCKTACKGAHGIKTHSAKIHGTIGSSRVSTLPRHRTQVPYIPQNSSPPPQIASFSPRLQNTSRFRPTASVPVTLQWTSSPEEEPLQRKRHARTPSPGLERNPLRQRLVLPELYFNDSGDLVPIDSEISASPASSTPESEPTSPIIVPESPIQAPESPISIASTELPSPTVAFAPARPSIMAPFQRTPDSVRPIRVQPTTLAEAHKQATDPITSNSSVQSLLAYAKVTIPEQRLHAKQAQAFTKTTDRVAQAFIRNPREKTLLYLLLLPRVLGIGLNSGHLKQTLEAYPTVLPPPPSTEEDTTPRIPGKQSPIDRAQKLLEKGYIGRASRALIDNTPLAPDTQDTLNTLYSKHPIGPHSELFQRSSPRPC